MAEMKRFVDHFDLVFLMLLKGKLGFAPPRDIRLETDIPLLSRAVTASFPATRQKTTRASPPHRDRGRELDTGAAG